ncbi:NAD(P)H-dependent oxidoreductase [Bdellovibrio sp. SKB1291214]|uniref:flavodoxin family protein n=1 Tax=Bdellovibrio sp. SKB1291214 TaxID=1732569 RepID=UPI000B519D81|nr:NAD(P)H-dependent oxidoreductase [Bdellovibrio sp. SKB1291214]UYL08595.1 NAD(P)H-dependent oxidoreductase [Bdellovibrio sp. SKB1291214]
MKKVLILNGSPSGDKGNCAVFIQKVHNLDKTLNYDVVHLAKTSISTTLKKKIAAADGVIFVTGTYWDSWGSPMQKLMEEMTDMEGTPALMGKPCAVMVLMHSVGGKSVLSRLQGVLSTMGFLIPPMSGMVYSLVSDIALKSKNTHAKDFWQIEDAELILENLKTAMSMQVTWTTWPVDKKDPRRKWFR